MDYSLLLAYDKWIRLFHIIGAVLALGAVATTDILLLWLKLKPKMAETVARISPLLSMQVWAGLFVLSVTGLLLFLPKSEFLVEFPKFQRKMLLVLVLFLNGIFLNVWVSPRFEKLAPVWHENTAQVKRFMIVAGFAATVSFLAWWGTLVLVRIF